MKNITALLERCRSLGATLTPVQGRLRVQAPRPLPDELVAELMEAKEEILAALRLRPESAVVWKGKPSEYRSLLVMREAELVVTKTQLTGNDHADWYVKNLIHNLENKISDLRKLLAEAMEKNNPTNTKQEEER